MNIENLRTTPGWALIREIKEEEIIKIFKKKSILDRKSVYGEVMTITPRISKTLESLPTCSKGDIVLFEKGGNETIKVNGEEYFFVQVGAILAAL